METAVAAVAAVGHMSTHPSMKLQVRKGLAWSALNSVALRAGTFVVGVVLARLLTPEQFGVYAVALTVQTVLITIADLGLSADLIRNEAPEQRAPTVGALGLLSGVLLAGSMAASAPGLANALGSPAAAPVIALLSITLVLAGAGVVPYAYLQREFRQKALFGIALVDFVVSTVVTVALVRAGWGPLSLAVGRVAAQTVTLTLQFVSTGIRPRYRVDRRVAGSVLRFGTPIAAANMLSWALLNIDNVVIVRVAGPTALGLYVLAFNISSWPMSVIGQVVRSVALPAFSRLKENQGVYGLQRALALSWSLALPAGAALAVLSDQLINAVYGGRWAAASPVLSALALFGALRVVFDLVVAYLLSRGASVSVLCIQILWFVALVPTMVVFTRRWGIAGGGWAHVAVSIGLVLPAYAWALSRVGVDLHALAAVLVPPALAAVPAAALAHWVAGRVSQDSLSLALGGVVGAMVYACLLGRWFLHRARGHESSPPDPDATDSTPVALPMQRMSS